LLPVMGSVSIDGSKYLTLTVDRSLSSSTGREPLVEVSSDLVNWFSGSRHTTVLIDNETILKVRDNTPTEPGRKRYIRLKPTTR
jgi:hypothetical protein